MATYPGIQLAGTGWFKIGEKMIKVTRLNGSDFWINAELIEFIEETPDTVLSLTTGHKFIVKESAQVIITAVIMYRRQIFQQSPQILKGGI